MFDKCLVGGGAERGRKGKIIRGPSTVVVTSGGQASASDDVVRAARQFNLNNLSSSQLHQNTAPLSV